MRTNIFDPYFDPYGDISQWSEQISVDLQTCYTPLNSSKSLIMSGKVM